MAKDMLKSKSYDGKLSLPATEDRATLRSDLSASWSEGAMPYCIALFIVLGYEMDAGGLSP